MSSEMDHFFRTQRRAAISQHPTQMGIDYVEFESAANKLKLYFIPADQSQSSKTVRPENISAANVRIQSEGGLEQHSIQVTTVELDQASANALLISLAVGQTGEGELPVYTLQLRDVPNLDPFFDQVNFSLQVDRPSELDPQATAVGAEAPQPVAEIDYLAKDYHSFRQLMLNRLSLLMAQWEERSPVDLGHVLVELLAYAGDYASYYQDAVATEAYLSTARRRVSVRRHARLIDYAMHEGCNARVWVQVQVNDNQTTLPAGSQLLTQVAGLPQGRLNEAAYQEALRRGATLFETMHEQALFAELNCIEFYTWGAREFVLPKGSTSATLDGNLSSLQPGQVLIFRQVRGAMTGDEADADPVKRHAVRLTEVTYSNDPLGGFLYNKGSDDPIEITEITWHDEDALPFDLVVSNNITSESEPISVAHGNIVLADHGRTIENDALVPKTVPAVGAYRPTLRRTDLTYAVAYDQAAANEASAAAFFRQMVREARPAITLEQAVNEGGSEGERQRWQPLPDLLDSDRFTRAFVVEMESDRRAMLRFGNGIQGQQPLAATTFTATYRVGNGLAGNVGRDVIRHLFVKNDNSFTGTVTDVSNWLPARGGIEPEPISEVRLYAPTAFQTQKRCVTEEDYVAIAKSHPDVQDASAILRWTGSWYTAIVLVKRRDSRLVDAAFQDKMQQFMEAYRVAGYDITIRGPRLVSLDIALTVHVASDYFASTVRQTLLETFSAVDLPTGQRAFFHSDNFTFGQSVYLSKLISRAVEVDGVTQVVPTRFQRWGRPPQAELESGLITISELEIAQLQNQALAPQYGRIVFTMKGGRQ